MERQREMALGWKRGGLALLLLGAWASAASAQSNLPDSAMLEDYVQAGKVEVAGLPIAGPENQLQAKAGVAAFVTADSLYVQALEKRMLLGPGACYSFAIIHRENTLAVPLPAGRIGNIPAMGLLRVQRGPSESDPVVATVAIALPGKLHLFSFQRLPGSPWVRRPASPVLALNTVEPWVRAFADLQETYPGTPGRGFLLLGMNGKMSRIDETASGMVETVLERSVTTSLLSQGGGWVGAFTGHIYRLAGTAAAPTLAAHGTQPAGQPILAIGPRSALVDGGYLLNQEGTWSAVRPGPADLRGLVPTATAEGTKLRLYRMSGRDTAETWDSPTTLAFRTGSAEWQRPGDRPIRVEGRLPVTFQVAFRDMDRNANPPSLELFHNDAGLGLFRPGAQADPALGCVQTGMCLPGVETILTVEMRADSVKLTMSVLEGVRGIDGVCLRPTWKGDRLRFVAAERWAHGSRLNVRVGSQSITFQNGDPVGLPMPQALRGSRAAAGGFQGGFRFLAFGEGGSRFGLDGRRREIGRPMPAADH